MFWRKHMTEKTADRLFIVFWLFAVITTGLLIPNAALWLGIGLLVIYYLVLMFSQYRLGMTSDEYFIFGRKMDSEKLTKTMVATNVGVASSVVFSAILGYFFGTSAMLWGPVTWIIGILLYILLIPKIESWMRTGRTLHEFLGESYSSDKVRVIASIVSVILLWGLLGVEVVIGSFLLTPFIGEFSSKAVAFFIVIITFSYMWLGGLKGVVRTDRSQLYVLFIGLVSLSIGGILISTKAISIPLEPDWKSNLFNLNFILLGTGLTIISLLVISLPYHFCVMDMWQRSIASTRPDYSSRENVKEIRKGLIKSIPFFVLLFWLSIIGGIFVRLIVGGEIDTNDILPTLLGFTGQVKVWGPILLAFALVAMLAAIMSTIDTILLAISQTLFYDVYALLPWNKSLRNKLSAVKSGNDKSIKITHEEDKNILAVGRSFIPIIGFTGVIFAFFEFQVMNFLFGLYGIIIVLFPSVIVAILWPRKLIHSSAVWSVSTGLISALIWSIYFTFVRENFDFVQWAGAWGLGIATLVYIIVTIIRQNKL